MPSFEYSAVDKSGRALNGAIAADDDRQALAELRNRGLFPTKLSRAAETLPVRSAGEWIVRRSGRLSGRDLAVLIRQLATLVRAGLALDSVLAALLDGQEKPQVRRLIADMLVQLREGRSLSEAVANQGSAFPDYVSAVIASGERTGQLAKVLEHLADYLEMQLDAGSKATTALIYPALVTLVSIGVAGMLLVYVAPEIVRMFERSGQPLPQITRVMLSVGEFLETFGVHLIVAIASVALLVRAGRRVESIRIRMDLALLRIPLVRFFVRARNAALFLRAFSIVMSSNVPVVEGLQLSLRVLDNRILHAEAEKAVTLVREGQSLTAALGAHRFLPPIALLLIEDGERSGRLDHMLSRAAVIVERDFQTARTRLVSVIEPLVLVCVGGLVLTIVLSVLLPIFDMQSILVK